MRAFIIKAGTEVKVIKKNKEWCAGNFVKHTTKQENLFFLEDIFLDPLGHVGTGPQYEKTIGGAYAKAGYYGFDNDTDFFIIAHASQVDIS